MYARFLVTMSRNRKQRIQTIVHMGRKDIESRKFYESRHVYRIHTKFIQSIFP